MSIDEDEVWLWYHHLENVKALGLAKGEYCTRFGLSKVKYANMKYLLYYCKDTNPERYNFIMDAAMEWGKVKGTMSLNEFCKPRRINKDHLSLATRHQELKYIILKRIADKVPPPELVEVKPDVAITDDYALERKRELLESIVLNPIIEEPEKLDEPTLEHFAVDEASIMPIQSLSDFISKRKIAEDPPPEVHFDEDQDKPEIPEPSKRVRKPKVLDPETDEPKEPMKFFTLQPSADKPIDDGIGRIGDVSWSDKPLAPNIHPEPEIQLKGNRIELTFTKTVRLCAAPDTPQAQLLDIITLLKDL